MKKLILPTLDLIQFCSEKKIRFIYFSSGGQIYGRNIYKANEEHSMNPFNYAGYSKCIVENAIIFFHKNFKLDYLILRPGNVFEMNEQNKIKKFSLISKINSLPANGAIHVRNNGNDIRDYIHIDQVSDIILTLVINNYRNITLNLSSGSGFKTKDVIKILNKKVKIVYKKNISSKNNQEAKKIILNNSLLKKIYKKKIINISKLNDL
jgi:UDP-glucose 4-epimerase